MAGGQFDDHLDGDRVQPYRLGRQDAARKVEALLINFPHLTFQDIDREITRLVAHIRAEYRLRAPDALQAAACLQAGATIFVTNDRELERLSPVLKVLVLDDYCAA